MALKFWLPLGNIFDYHYSKLQALSVPVECAIKSCCSFGQDFLMALKLGQDMHHMCDYIVRLHTDLFSARSDKY